MEKGSLVLESAIGGDESGMFVSVFSSEMDGSDDCANLWLTDLNSILSAAKIQHLEKFLTENPQTYA